jgi:hypothetical protein
VNAHKNLSRSSNWISVSAIIGITVGAAAICLCGAGWLYFGCRCSPHNRLERSFVAHYSRAAAKTEADPEVDVHRHSVPPSPSPRPSRCSLYTD